MYDVPRIFDALTRVPTGREMKSYIKSPAMPIGIGLGALIGALSAKNKLAGMGIGALLGGGAAFGGKILGRNIRTAMGGHYDRDPDYYDVAKFRQMLDPNTKTVTLYVNGAGTAGAIPYETSRGVQGNVFSFGWGDGDKLREIIDSIPEGYEINLIGHSSGGGTIMNTLWDVSRSVNNVKLLDPVDLNLYSRTRAWMNGGYAVPSSVRGTVEVYMPETWRTNRGLPRNPVTTAGSDYSVHNNPLRMVDSLPSTPIVVPGVDHYFGDHPLQFRWGGYNIGSAPWYVAAREASRRIRDN